MNALEKENLIIEANMQMTALHKINGWRKLAMTASGIGMAVAYAGLSGTPSHLFPGILGIVIMIAGFGAAAVCNLGLKNGRRNVEKMIHVVEAGRKGSGLEP